MMAAYSGSALRKFADPCAAQASGELPNSLSLTLIGAVLEQHLDHRCAAPELDDALERRLLGGPARHVGIGAVLEQPAHASGRSLGGVVAVTITGEKEERRVGVGLLACAQVGAVFE